MAYKKERCDVYPICLLQNFQDLRNGEILCDVRLAAEGREILAHRSILAAASPYFRAMFTCSLRECTENVVHMGDVDFRTLSSIIDFIYTAEIQITDENVFNIIVFADFLQLSALRPLCSQYLIKSLNYSNCLPIYAIALKYDYQDLGIVASRYIRCNFKFVIEQEEFKDTPLEILYTLLQGRFLNVSDEGVLLKAVVQWISVNPEERKEYLKSLSSLINLVQVPITTLIDLKSHPLLENSDLKTGIDSTISTILEERYEVDVRSMWALNLKEKARKMLRYTSDRAVVLALGGEYTGMPLGNLECFIFGCDSWKCAIPSTINRSNGKFEDSNVLPTLLTARYNFGVASREGEIFVVGGSTESSYSSSVEVFNASKNEWKGMPKLPKELAGPRAAFLDGLLYVTGGLGKNGFENGTWVFDEKSSCWRERKPMNFPRGFHGLVGVSGSLYAVGGKSANNEMLSSIERFDPITNRWYNLSNMQIGRYDFGCVALHHHIFVLGGIGTTHLRNVERYNTLTNQWNDMVDMSVARSGFGVTLSDDRIYCIGGYDGTHMLKTVEKFNPSTNRWHCVSAMHNIRHGCGAATLRVPEISDECGWAFATPRPLYGRKPIRGNADIQPPA